MSENNDNDTKHDEKNSFLRLGKNPTGKKPDTAILSNSGGRWRQLNNQNLPNGTATLGIQREVIFVIRGMIERVKLTNNLAVVLGRFDAGTEPGTHIDLNPYGALDRGVSRMHAKLTLKNNHLYITDLGSTNGTYLAGKKLEPNKTELLRKGDELLLGRLAIQVLFR